MTEFLAGQFDIAVIGAGHAGIEAALAPPGWGWRTIVFTINLDAVGNMPCNPAIGGTGKGHLVRELDALGGRDGEGRRRVLHPVPAAEQGKGPRRLVPRAQADRRRYQGVHEAHPGAAGPSDGPARARWWRSARRTARFPPWCWPPGGVLREGRDPGHRHISGGPHHRGRVRGGIRPRQDARRRTADGLPC